MTVKQELNQLLYKQQEESYSHISIEEEFAFYPLSAGPANGFCCVRCG